MQNGQGFSGLNLTRMRLNSVGAQPTVAGIAALVISGIPSGALLGQAFNFIPVVSGGSGVKSYTLTGSMPAGLSFSSATGAITGTPTSAGTTTNIGITVRDESGQASLTGLSISVTDPTVSLNNLFQTASDRSFNVYTDETDGGRLFRVARRTVGSTLALTSTDNKLRLIDDGTNAYVCRSSIGTIGSADVIDITITETHPNATNSGNVSTAKVNGIVKGNWPAVLAAGYRVCSMAGQVNNASYTYGGPNSLGTRDRFITKKPAKLGRCSQKSLRIAYSTMRLDTITSREEQSGPPLEILAVAVEIPGAPIPVVVGTYGGQKSFTIPAARDLEFIDEITPAMFGLKEFEDSDEPQVTTVGRINGLSPTVYSPGQTIGQSFLYDSAVVTTDPETLAKQQGVIGQPSGGASLYMPSFVMVVGLPVDGKTQAPSCFIAGDSITDRLSDGGGDGRDGGNYAKRSLFAQGIPYFSHSLGGRQIGHWASNHYMSRAYSKFCTFTYCGLGNNDVNGGRDEAPILADFADFYAERKADGHTAVIQGTIPPRISSGTKNASGDNILSNWRATDLEHQTPFATSGVGGLGFELGGVKDRVNDAIRARIGKANGADILLDVATFCSDSASGPSKWKLRTFTAALTTAHTAGTTTFVMDQKPDIDECFVIEPGTTNVEPIGTKTGAFRVISVAGTGPYTVTFGGEATSLAHPVGAVVRATNSADETHFNTPLAKEIDVGGLRPIVATFLPSYTFTNTEAAGFVGRLTASPSDKRRGLYDKLYTDLKKVSTLLPKLDYLYIHGAHSEEAARLNLVSTAYTITSTSTATYPGFLKDRGYKGDGSTKFGASNFNPSAATGARYQTNNAHIGVYMLEFSAGNIDLGASNNRSNISVGATSVGGRINQTTGGFSASGLPAATSRHGIVNRSGASASNIYADGASAATNPTASTSMPSGLEILRGNNVYADGRVGASHAGEDLTTAEAACLYTSLNNWMKAVGAVS
ncbi:Ig domain-containing protein [Aureimonas sp. AU40]|uniref:Ig domain-containing protein n=1 Tax=Aureimonas sp. AU40 TaxID=1637747 RepID=UPI0009EBE9EA|nr:Ig domain-containing protein [Aureimonas sp. AU40]